jgi:hypothetical protein
MLGNERRPEAEASGYNMQGRCPLGWDVRDFKIVGDTQIRLKQLRKSTKRTNKIKQNAFPLVSVEFIKIRKRGMPAKSLKPLKYLKG